MARRKVTRRERRHPKVVPARCSPGRHYTVYPDLDRRRFTVEVYIARGPQHFREVVRQQGFMLKLEHGGASGIVFSRKRGSRHSLYHGRVVAYMMLDRKELQKRRSEVLAHECGHAAMAWARFRRADLSVMGDGDHWRRRKSGGEELLCYSIGELVDQVNRICFAARVWERSC